MFDHVVACLINIQSWPRAGADVAPLEIWFVFNTCSHNRAAVYELGLLTFLLPLGHNLRPMCPNRRFSQTRNELVCCHLSHAFSQIWRSLPCFLDQPNWFHDNVPHRIRQTELNNTGSLFYFICVFHSWGNKGDGKKGSSSGWARLAVTKYGVQSTKGPTDQMRSSKYKRSRGMSQHAIMPYAGIYLSLRKKIKEAFPLVHGLL